jgi:hypothetical protein
LPTAFTSEAVTEKVFEAHRELVEQVASELTTLVQALMSLASFSSLRRRSPEWAAAREEKSNREGHVSQQANPQKALWAARDKGLANRAKKRS